MRQHRPLNLRPAQQAPVHKPDPTAPSHIDGYTIEMIQDAIDYIPSLVELVTDGVYDDNLTELFNLFRDRRIKVQGRPTRESGVTKSPLKVGVGFDPSAVNLRRGRQQIVMLTHTSQGVQKGNVVGGTGTFDQSEHPRSSHMVSWRALQGQNFVVTGLGAKKVQIKFIAPVLPSVLAMYSDEVGHDKPIFLEHELLRNLRTLSNGKPRDLWSENMRRVLGVPEPVVFNSL